MDLLVHSRSLRWIAPIPQSQASTSTMHWREGLWLTRTAAEVTRLFNSPHALSAAGNHHYVIFWEVRAVRGAIVTNKQTVEIGKNWEPLEVLVGAWNRPVCHCLNQGNDTCMTWNWHFHALECNNIFPCWWLACSISFLVRHRSHFIRYQKSAINIFFSEQWGRGASRDYHMIRCVMYSKLYMERKRRHF